MGVERKLRTRGGARKRDSTAKGGPQDYCVDDDFDISLHLKLEYLPIKPKTPITKYKTPPHPPFQPEASTRPLPLIPSSRLRIGIVGFHSGGFRRDGSCMHLFVLERMVSSSGSTTARRETMNVPGSLHKCSLNRSRTNQKKSIRSQTF